MRRIVWMLMLVLGSAGLMYAQSSAPMKLGGTVCQATCVVASSPDLSTCDPLCTDKGGQAVFVDDQGNVRNIEDQTATPSSMAVPSSTVTPPEKAVPTEKQREDKLRIEELYEYSGY